MRVTREQFLAQGRTRWSELESLLREVERSGLAKMSTAEVRRFGALYRSAAADLTYAKTRVTSTDVTEYLNALVARAYAQIYARRRFSFRGAGDFFARTFPATFRASQRAFWWSMATFVLGAVSGAAAIHVDPGAREVLLPFDHARVDPKERVAAAERRGSGLGSGESATFSAFLFTHNLRVAFLCFALGLTFGVGTLLTLFLNGVGLGALAYVYHEAGVGLFFWAWILPHGVPELFVVFLAGGAGLLAGRALIAPGNASRAQALRANVGTGVRLLLGGAPILVLAGLIEGTVSQVHAPDLVYESKLALAGALFAGLAVYLSLAGRRAPTTDRERPLSV